MEIVSKNKKVSLAYTLKDMNGTIIEEVPDNFPFLYMHGCDSIIVGLEEALEGHKKGDHLVINVPYDKGYGAYRKDLIIEIKKDELKNIGEIWIGMELEMFRDDDNLTEFSIPEDPKDIYARDDSQDDPDVYVIREIKEKTVTLDGNHPFAGKDLVFEVTIVDIQEPTITELETGFPDEDTDDSEDDFNESSDDNPEDDHSNFGRHWR